jgi:hypothetical protein
MYFLFGSLAMNRLRFLAAVVALAAHAADSLHGGELLVKAVDRDTGDPLAVRMHLKDQQGKPVEAGKAPFWKDHFVFDGEISLKLKPGRYTFEMERGPEYRVRTGYFTIERTSKDAKTVDMSRFVDMAGEGWWSGDLHVHRSVEDIELLMRAEDLHVAPVITWWNDRNLWSGRALPENPLRQFDKDRFYHVLAGEDERGGGALLYFHLSEPLPIAGAQREYPSSTTFLQQAREENPGLHVDIEKPFWWDAPVWAATGLCHSIGVCNNHQWRDGMLDNEAWGKPRDKTLFPAPAGNARWTQAIYFHLLNSGLRIPPSAGSASGVLPNPVGYNRVYVHCGEEFTWQNWWTNLRAGRVVVTNGPLLRPQVNGELPGHVFQGREGQTLELETALSLSTRDKIEYLEIIKNGEAVESVRLDEYVKAGGKLPVVKFTESGWFAVRAVANHPATYRFALTGPYHVEFDYKPRISKESSQFFLDWVNERMSQIKLSDPDQQRAVLAPLLAAKEFWTRRVQAANAP